MTLQKPGTNNDYKPKHMGKTMKTISAKFTLAATLAAVLSTPIAFAQESTATPTTSVTTADTKPAPSARSPWILGFKSTIDSARRENLYVDGKQTMNAKNELQVGYRHQSGWGGFMNFVQNYRTYNDNAVNAKYWSASDPSITIQHPDFYKSDTLTVFGAFRYYFRTTDRSINKEIDHYTYYFRQNLKLSDVHNIYNELIPRYQVSKNYSPGDTTYYVEDMTIYDYKLSDSWKIGAKQWTQYEVHAADPAGLLIEVGPTATYAFSRNVSISPSIMMPIAVENRVYNGATNATLDQAYANIYFQARF